MYKEMQITNLEWIVATLRIKHDGDGYYSDDFAGHWSYDQAIMLEVAFLRQSDPFSVWFSENELRYFPKDYREEEG